jgi:hypothetical protein
MTHSPKRPAVSRTMQSKDASTSGYEMGDETISVTIGDTECLDKYLYNERTH